MGLHVETRIRADLDDLWTHTRDPALHRRWDLRFTAIEYLPRGNGEPRRVRYSTRVPPFLTIAGTGVPAGERKHPDGTRTSTLRFTSPHPLSPLAEGTGTWRYVPDGDGVRFLTAYEHRPRRAVVGGLADRLVLRPPLVWATAWSIDRLRLWLERGITPERALLRRLAELAVRALVIALASTGTGLESVLGLLGPYALPAVYLSPLMLSLLVCLALFKAPLAGTPAARRCRRTPPARGRAPYVLRPLLRPLKDPARGPRGALRRRRRAAGRRLRP
ncbi:hypothetical protein [Streptomyces sp. NPDC003247]|uniref:hypothetical protein n=1 Tax=Streptomyces sp. NPDC003247 TaxID=3364677 RepID=UPI0036BDEE31